MPGVWPMRAEEAALSPTWRKMYYSPSGFSSIEALRPDALARQSYGAYLAICSILSPLIGLPVPVLGPLPAKVSALGHPLPKGYRRSMRFRY